MKVSLTIICILCMFFNIHAQDRSSYNLAKEAIETFEVDEILNTAPLEKVIQLKNLLPKLKNDLLDELKIVILITEKQLARKKIERSFWMNGVIEYILLSYNLELIIYACELRINNSIEK